MNESTDSNVSLRPWLVYPKLVVDEVSMGTASYKFFAEDLSAEPVVLDELQLEFYNHELQKVDTTSLASMRAFCEKYGLLYSPLYSSKTHALQVRKSKAAAPYYIYYPTVFRKGIEAVRQRITADIASFRGGSGFADAGRAVELLVGSEYAREVVAGDQFSEKPYGAVVSVDEVAYTIRLLQIATAIQAAAGAGISGNRLDAYISQGAAVSNKVPDKLQDSYTELFMKNGSIAAILLKKQEAELGHEIGSDEATERDASIKRMRASYDIALLQAVEDARSFTAQTVIALEMENAGIRELPDFKDPDDRSNYKHHDMSEGSLVESILANFEYVLNSKQDWIICEYCGRAFKYQKDYDQSKRYRQATFCKNSCRVMAAQSVEGS